MYFLKKLFNHSFFLEFIFSKSTLSWSWGVVDLEPVLEILGWEFGRILKSKRRKEL